MLYAMNIVLRTGFLGRKLLNSSILQIMHEHHIINSTPVCPVCNKKQDGALGAERAPNGGDYSVCAYCASINRYEFIKSKLSLRKVNKKDLEVARNEGILEQLIALHTVVLARVKSKSSFHDMITAFKIKK